VRASRQALADQGLAARCSVRAARSIDPRGFSAIHQDGMISSARDACDRGGCRLDADTPESRRSYGGT
jgi:hypothetical protein